MTINTYEPNNVWMSAITTYMIGSESCQTTKIVYILYGRDNIVVPDSHLHRDHFRETNWRIQSIGEIWIIWVFISKAGTHSMALSQYISIPAQWVLLNGMHCQSMWWYGMDSELRMNLLDVPISMYMVPYCVGFGPKAGNYWSVTVLVIPSNNILFL
jgi:hypothetical protein